jgi:hypothetical protein
VFPADLRRLQVRVAHHGLNEPDIRAAFQHQRRHRVPKQMASALLTHARFLHIPAHYPGQVIQRERLAGIRQEHYATCSIKTVTYRIRRPDTNTQREHAQQLLNRLGPDQVDAMVHLMEVMLDPLSRKLALAAIDDEPFTEQDRQAVAEADQWLQNNQPIPLENVLADFGLTMTDWETMAKTPLAEDNGQRDG